jgi:HEAT repeat protein
MLTKEQEGGKSLTEWLKALEADDPGLRWQAAEALGQIGLRQPRAVVKALSRAANDPDLDVRLQAVASLTGLQANAENAVPAMENALQSADSDLRRQVALAVSSVGPLAEEASASLGQLLHDPNTNVRLSAISALGAIGPDSAAALDDLADALRDKVPSVRRAGAAVLGRIAADADPKMTIKAVAALAGALKDRDPEVCRQSTRALGALGPRSEAALPELGETARTAAEELRGEAASALGQIGVTALPELLRNLTHDNPGVRSEAVSALQQLGYQAWPAFKALCGALQDAAKYVRQAAMSALTGLNPAPEVILSVLLAASRSDEDQRRWAVVWLGQIAVGVRPTLARQALERLIACLEDGDVHVRFYAAKALGEVGAAAKPAVAALLKQLASPDNSVRLNAALVLGKIDPTAARQAVPLLIQSLPTTSSRYSAGGYSGEAVRALAAIGDVAPLLEALKHKDEAVRTGATAALTALGKKSQVLQYLREQLRDRDAGTRQRAANAVQAMAPDPDEAVPVLLESLQHADDAIRQWAAAYLGDVVGQGDLSPRAPETLAPLTALLKDPAGAVRESAANALGKIVEHLPRPAEALPAETAMVQGLIVSLLDVNAAVGHASALALGKIGAARKGQGAIQEAVPVLINVLNAGRPFLSESAAALGQIGLTPPLVEALMNNTDEKIRTGAANALGLVGPDLLRGDENGRLGPVLSVLVQGLKDQEPHARQHSALALAELGRVAASAVPALCEALQDGDSVVPPAALSALASIGPEADLAVPALIQLLSQPPSRLRNQALDSLASIGAAAVPALTTALGSGDPDVVQYSAMALQRIGRKAYQAEPALLNAFARSTENTRQAVADALAVIVNKADNPAMIPALALALPRLDQPQKEHVVGLLFAYADGPHAHVLPLVVEALLEELRSWASEDPNANVNLHRRIVRTLGRMGPAALAALPALIDALERENLREDVARALRAVVAPHAGPAELALALKDQAGLDDRQTALVLSSADAAPLLLESLKHRNARVRAASAWALGALAPKTNAVLAALVQACQDPNRAVRLAALDAVLPQATDGQSSRLVPALIEAAESWDVITRVRAGLCLTEFAGAWLRADDDGKAIADVAAQVLLEALQTGSPGEARVAQYATQMGQLKSVLDLLPSSADLDPQVRLRVVAVLGKASLWQNKNLVAEEDGQRVQQLLTAALLDPNASVREQAARSLGQLGPMVKGAAAALKDLLHDRQPAVCEAAAIALWQIAQQTENVAPLLIENLQQSSYDSPGLIEDVRQGRSPSRALATLADMDSQAEEALIKALGHDNPAIRAGAAVALGSRKGPNTAACAGALASTLMDRNAMVRTQAVVAVRYQSKGQCRILDGVVSRLEQLCQSDPENVVCLEALTTLGVLGPAKNLEPGDVLVGLLRDRRPEVRAEAVRTLGLLGKGTDQVVAKLRLCLKDRSPTVRERTAVALGQLGAAGLPALKEALTDKDAEIRRWCVLALECMGAAAKPVFADLQALRTDPDEEVRSAVEEAVAKLVAISS